MCVIYYLERETRELLYSLENDIFTQYGNSRLQCKRNVDVHKWDPNVDDFRYCHVNVHVSNSALPKCVNPKLLITYTNRLISTLLSINTKNSC